MAFLCISNSKKSNNVVIVKEGKLYEIDRETSRYVNSAAILKKYKKEVEKFKRLFPDHKNINIYILNDDLTPSNEIVIYQTHRMAFDEIVKNKSFMRYLCKVEYARLKDSERYGERYEVFIEEFERKGILWHNFNRSVERVISILRSRDKDKDGVSRGGKRFYGFVRYVLTRYDYFVNNKNPELPNVNDIIYDKLNQLSSVALQKEEEIRTIADPDIEEIKRDNIITETDFVDQIGYDLMDPQEDLYSFFKFPNFDRYYDEPYHDQIAILGTSKNREDYQKIYEISANCFSGNICCPVLGEQSSLLKKFDDSKLVIFYVDEKDKSTEYLMARSIQNQAGVVILSAEPELIAAYTKKYKGSIGIICGEEQKNEMENELVQVFINLYNSEYRRFYDKR